MDARSSLRRAATDIYDNGLPHGWATTSLRRSLNDVALAVLIMIELVMLWAVISSGAPRQLGLPLLAGHLLLLAAMVTALRGRFPASVLLGGMWAMALAHWAVADSIENVLAFSGCWLYILPSMCAPLLMRGRRALYQPLILAFVVPAALYGMHPEWGTRMPEAVAVTTLTIIVATRFGLQGIIDFAGRADAAAAEAETETERSLAVRVASAQASEDARILHDTVINTLGAIVRGGAATSDLEAVRARCAADAETARGLGSGSRSDLGFADAMSGVVARFTHPVVRTGLDTTALARLVDSSPDAPWRELAGMIHELVQNAVQHSAATTIVLDITLSGDDLVVTVRDDGRGFDGRVVPGRGLATSVMDRARLTGTQVDLDTAPGRGTEVTVTCPVLSTLRADVGADDQVFDEAEVVNETMPRLHARAGLFWASGLTAVGVALSLSNHAGAWTEHYAMTAVAAVASAYGWWRGRSRELLPRDAVVVLVVGASAAFVFSAAAIGFGRTEIVYWQTIGPTAPLIMLVASRRRPHTVAVAVAFYLATVLATIGWEGSSEAAAVLPVGGLIVVGMVVGWDRFQDAVTRIGIHAAQDQRVILASRLDSVTRVSAAQARRRWREAGLDDSAELLRDIASGRQDPRATAVRARCAAEEAYLRQLMLLEPDLVLMGRWFAQALKTGFDREVGLVVRTGAVDAPDRRTADLLGQFVLRAVEAVPAGSTVVTTLYSVSESIQLTLVGPATSLRVPAAHPENVQLSARTVGDQEIVTVVLPS